MAVKKVRKKAAVDTILGGLGKKFYFGLDRCGSECLFCVIGTERKFLDVANNPKQDYSTMERIEMTVC